MSSLPSPRTLVLTCALTLLSGCATLSPSGTPAARPDAVAQVAVLPGDTRGAVAARHHASVLEFEPDEGYAIVGARASTGGVSALSAAGFEPNAGQFTGATATMHGTRTLWADGDPVFSSLRAWAGGTRTLWADGTFQPVPENTAVLRFAGLSTAQTLAPRLGSGVKVAVIDTGVDLNHPAFQGALAPAGEWWDFSANDAVPQEEGPGGRGYGHGTAVASIVLQVAPGATILPLRVLGPDGSGDVLAVQRAIDWAVARGARVINLSLGSAARSNVVQQAVARAARKNVLVVSSGGNENRPALTYPAADADKGSAGERGVSVASVDVTGVKSSFSNYARDVELSAPGERVLGAYPDGQAAAWSGTSMSVPLLAGALALALAQDPELAPSDLTGAMLDTARDLSALPGNRAYAGMLGSGALDVDAFLKRSLARPAASR